MNSSSSFNKAEEYWRINSSFNEAYDISEIGRIWLKHLNDDRLKDRKQYIRIIFTQHFKIDSRQYEKYEDDIIVGIAVEFEHGSPIIRIRNDGPNINVSPFINGHVQDPIELEEDYINQMKKNSPTLHNNVGDSINSELRKWIKRRSFLIETNKELIINCTKDKTWWYNDSEDMDLPPAPCDLRLLIIRDNFKRTIEEPFKLA